MKDFPLVSVAIITYNQKDYLRECIESVLAQDYPNIEIVVADDASTDDTQDMLKEYDQKYPGKFVLRLSEKNQGITANSNLAHFACSGKYIAWMGGDDLMLPGKITDQVSMMESDPECTISYHDLEFFESNSNKKLYLKSEKFGLGNFFVNDVIRNGTLNGACASMIRASKAPAHGFNRDIPVASDWLYWVETMMDDGKMCYINKVLGRHRRHENNVTNPKKDGTVGQNVVDILNSCNYIMSIYPCYFKDAMHRYSQQLVSLRFVADYKNVLLFSLKIKFRFKYFIALAIYILSIGKIKC
jgi:glycosyltransferase involved in cell wall biosynthesis